MDLTFKCKTCLRRRARPWTDGCPARTVQHGEPKHHIEWLLKKSLHRRAATATQKHVRFSLRRLVRTTDYLQAVRQSAELSSAVTTEPRSLLLGFGLLGPRQGERGGEEEAGLQAPVRWILCAHGGSYGGRSNGLRTLGGDICIQSI